MTQRCDARTSAPISTRAMVHLSVVVLLFVVVAAIAADVSPASAPATRRAIPDVRAQANAEKAVKDVFRDYAKLPVAERAAVAQKMMAQADASANDAAVQYVLLKHAADLAAAAGDVKLAMKAASAIAAAFAVDPIETKLELLRKVAASSGPGQGSAARAVAAEYLELADEAQAAGKYDVVGHCASLAEGAARTANDPSLLARAQARAGDSRWLQQESARAKMAEQRLARNPADAEANLVRGVYLCAARGDWSAALPLLAKGSNPAIKATAAADVANPTTNNDQIAVGDAWWNAAEKETAAAGPPQAAMRARAAFWYGKVLDRGQIEGLSRARLEKRVAAVKTGGGAVAGRNILLFTGKQEDEKLFEQVAGTGNFKPVVHGEETAKVLVQPNPFADFAIVAWGVNQWRDLNITDLNDNAQRAMVQFVTNGGDLIFFEQYTATHMGIVEKLFGFKVDGGGTTGAEVLVPELKARLQQAGYTDSMLAAIDFFNWYGNLPKGAVVLVRGGKDHVPTVVVAPYGKGRLILIGTSMDKTDLKFDDEVIDLIYHFKERGAKP